MTKFYICMKLLWEASFQNGLCFIHCEKDKKYKTIDWVCNLFMCLYKTLGLLEIHILFYYITQSLCYILSSKYKGTK